MMIVVVNCERENTLNSNENSRENESGGEESGVEWRERAEKS